MRKLSILAFMSVLLLCGVAQAAEEVNKTPETVMKLMKANKDLSKFVELIDASGAKAVFEADTNAGLITVFAPNNAAVDKIPSDIMKKAKANKDGLKTLVMYHTIPGSQVLAGNVRGRKAGPSAGTGETVTFDGTGKDLKINDAVIVTPDQFANNGVVQIINAALLSPSLVSDKPLPPTPEVKIDAKKPPVPPATPVEEKAAESAKAEPTAPVKAEPATSDAAQPPVAPAPEKKQEKKGLLKKLFNW